jgi:glycine dehydrogenase
MSPNSPLRSTAPLGIFPQRHIGPDESEIQTMLATLGLDSLEQLMAETIPDSIRLTGTPDLPAQPHEHLFLREAREIASQNRVLKSLIGQGYYGTLTPTVIARNILENPGWYTQYTPYQAEISQGRLEALLNYQTLVCDLTGLPISNASLLDEGTAAAEAMSLLYATRTGPDKKTFLVSSRIHPQTLAVLSTRAEPLEIEIRCEDIETHSFTDDVFGALWQNPDTFGRVEDLTDLVTAAQKAGVRTACATDLLACTLLTSPGEMGFDLAFGSSQRLGVPMGFGGPHAAFFAGREAYKRQFPGRIIGLSVDRMGQPALRMALQTREQHIRREKATSNICTAQVLLAVMASTYAVYHGPIGLKAIAGRIHALARTLAAELRGRGCVISKEVFFDTLHLRLPDGGNAETVRRECEISGYNIRLFKDGTLGISLDETCNESDINELALAFERALGRGTAPSRIQEVDLHANPTPGWPESLQRKSAYLTHPVFHRHHSETSLLRYLHGLERKDLSLTTSMIPLGSCTMKLNATSEMIPVSWPEFADIHPFAPARQTPGYRKMLSELEVALARLTDLPGVSLQPNAGSQGEYAGLLVIRAWHRSRGHTHRNICLIPASAHGTNPASAVMAGMLVRVVKCDEQGNIDHADLLRQADAAGDQLCALMVTYPSTHGVFEEGIQEACRAIHERGGQVYLDGANLNAQVGWTSPGRIGADVCHINLHKTFCIPHGGGGPGMGPICVAEHLSPFLPGHPESDVGGAQAISAVSAAPYGSALILPISWAYIRMMGGEALKKATAVAILNANYLAEKLKDHYALLYRGRKGRVAHELILDCRAFKASAGVEVEDIAKRLMDYGFHAPTVSFPVAGTLMIEPTESENQGELDRFCFAMIAIRKEIAEIERGEGDLVDNPLKNAPHTAEEICGEVWPHPYSREKAAFPLASLRRSKFWPQASRVQSAYGDKNLQCTCPPLEDYAQA